MRGVAAALADATFARTAAAEEATAAARMAAAMARAAGATGAAMAGAMAAAVRPARLLLLLYAAVVLALKGIAC